MPGWGSPSAEGNVTASGSSGWHLVASDGHSDRALMTPEQSWLKSWTASTRPDATNESRSTRSSLTWRPSFTNGIRRSATRRRMKRGLTPRYAAAAGTSRSGRRSASPPWFMLPTSMTESFSYSNSKDRSTPRAFDSVAGPEDVMIGRATGAGKNWSPRCAKAGHPRCADGRRSSWALTHVWCGCEMGRISSARASVAGGIPHPPARPNGTGVGFAATAISWVLATHRWQPQ